MTIYGNSFWEIIKPAETTNLVQNPSIEKNITGYAAASGATAASTSASQFFGIYSLQVTPTSASSDGVYYGANSIPVGLTTGCAYAFSLFFKGQASIPYQIYFATTGGTLVGSSLQFTATGDWERKSVTYIETSSASRRLYVTKNNSANTGVFIIDGLQCERVDNAGASPTTYCDGDQEGCIWLADRHGSQSWRDGQSRGGGQIINLNRDYDIIVRQQPGTGMPPVENVQTSLGIQDGGLFQRTRTEVRSFSLDGVISGSDVADFHYNRNRLIDLFKSDGGTPQQPFLLRYTTGSAITKQIKAHYDGGFELSQVTANIEMFTVRLIAYDPYWEEIKETCQVLSTIGGLGGIDFAVSLGDNSGNDQGDWDSADDQGPAKFVKGPDNKLYYTSNTHTVRRYNFQDRAVENFLPSATGCKFHASAGRDNASPHDIAFDTAGNLYIVGDFHATGSTTASRIVKWDGNDYSTVGDGFNGTATAVMVDREGSIYVGGSFDQSGSVTACGMAKITASGTEFTSIGSGLQGSGSITVHDIKQEISGSNFYVVGDFTLSGADSVCRLAYFDGSTFNNVGGASINNTVRAIAIKNDDTVFFAGEFTGAFPDSAGSPSYFTHWDGQSFTIPSDNSPTSPILDIDYDSQSGLLAAGAASPGGVPTLNNPRSSFIWNGSVWTYSRILPLGDTNAIFFRDGIMAVGNATVTDYSAVSVPVVTTLNNPGGATVYPEIIWSLNSSVSYQVIYLIDNISTGKSLILDMIILGGEEIVLDLRQGTIISSNRGSIIGEIVPGSNFSTWQLKPGDNIISAFAGGNVVLAIRWRNRYWSIDG